MIPSCTSKRLSTIESTFLGGVAPRFQSNNCAARLTLDAVKVELHLASDEANEDAELALDEVRKEACLDPNKTDKDGLCLFTLFGAQPALVLALDRAREDLQLANKSSEPLSSPTVVGYITPIRIHRALLGHRASFIRN